MSIPPEKMGGLQLAEASRHADGQPAARTSKGRVVRLRPAPDQTGPGIAKLRLLLIEDSQPYAALVEAMLCEALELPVELTHRESVWDARQALVDQQFDCVLLDLSLPDAAGLEALEEVQTIAAEVAVVVLTGSDDRALAIDAMQAGAQDFLVKRTADGELLMRAIRYSIERKRAETRLAHQALHDTLTGLPNRLLLIDRLEVALARSRRRPGAVAVLFLDIDRFKTVNDSLGHDAGDELLVEIARRLERSVRPGDTVARFGGDEFLILCEDLTARNEAARVAERVRASGSTPITLRGHEISVHVSVGIAFTGAARPDAQTLIREADAAMYRAKRLGSGIELFEAAMHAEAMAQLATEHQLPGAVERGELRLHYQPAISLTGGGRPFGAEALVRWQHPHRGLLMPSEFIGLAEETGTIMRIGEWVLIEACTQLARWRADMVVADDFTVSVNLSPRQLGNRALPEAVARALAVAELPPRCLCLEITESWMARDAVRAAAMLDALKSLGVLIALDDFGTGYSSLSALSSYPLDVVKIDRSFIEKVAVEPGAARMFGAVIGVIRAAELQAVAEGIESPAQLELVRTMGCDVVQGFLFAEPAPPARTLTWLRSVCATPEVGERA